MILTTTRKFLTAIVGVLLIANRASATIINGSFETPVVPSSSFINYGGGSTAITGWTVVGVETSVVNTTFTQSGITFQAQSGNQWADMAGVTSNSNSSGLRQIVATVPGQLYNLEFYVGSATGGGVFFPATVDLSIDGGARVSYFNPTGPSDALNWMHFSVPFTATSAATSLTFFNGSAANNFISALDNVTLEAAPVPEPSTLALLGTVTIGLLGWAVKAKRVPCGTERQSLA